MELGSEQELGKSYLSNMEVTIAENQPVERKKKIEKILDEKESATGLCPIHDFLNHFATKWSMLVVLNLGYADKPRFNELKSMITGISQRMLTVTLRSLESDGLVSRKLYAEIPPRVEYELTPLGRSLLDVMMSLGEWATRHKPEITMARKKFKKNHPEMNF
jgi:DNA-binding HxlR family transcriptional regulator